MSVICNPLFPEQTLKIHDFLIQRISDHVHELERRINALENQITQPNPPSTEAPQAQEGNSPQIEVQGQ